MEIYNIFLQNKKNYSSYGIIYSYMIDELKASLDKEFYRTYANHLSKDSKRTIITKKLLLGFKDKEFCKELIRINPTLYVNVIPKKYITTDMILKAVEKDPSYYMELNGDMKNDPAVCNYVVLNKPSMIDKIYSYGAYGAMKLNAAACRAVIDHKLEDFKYIPVEAQTQELCDYAFKKAVKIGNSGITITVFTKMDGQYQRRDMCKEIYIKQGLELSGGSSRTFPDNVLDYDFISEYMDSRLSNREITAYVIASIRRTFFYISSRIDDSLLERVRGLLDKYVPLLPLHSKQSQYTVQDYCAWYKTTKEYVMGETGSTKGLCTKEAFSNPYTLLSILTCTGGCNTRERGRNIQFVSIKYFTLILMSY